MDRPTNEEDRDIVQEDASIEIGVAEVDLSEPDVSDFAKTLEMPRVKLDNIAVGPLPLPTPPPRGKIDSLPGMLPPPPVSSPRVRTDSLSAAAVPPSPAREAPAPQQTKRSSMAVAFLAGLAVGVAGIVASSIWSKPTPPAAPAPTVAPVPLPPAPTVTAEEPKPVEATEAPAASEAPSQEAPPRAPVAPRAPVERPAAAPPPAPVTRSSALPADLPSVSTAPKPPSGDIDRLAVASAISAVGARASACRDTDTPAGSVPVSITFLPSGRTGQATVSGPLQGTAVGRCIVEALRAATVPPFVGEAVTVSTAINLR